MTLAQLNHLISVHDEVNGLDGSSHHPNENRIVVDADHAPAILASLANQHFGP